jgi:hypothetical protein
VGVELTEAAFGEVWETISPVLDERQRRVVAGAIARACGRGGVAGVARATGMSRSTVNTGSREVASGDIPQGRVRRPGAGRPSNVDKDAELLPALDSLVEPESRGDPMSPLRWTTKSLQNLSDELGRLGRAASTSLVAELLRYMGYSLQAPSKQAEGRQHPDRDGQFRYINTLAGEHLAAGDPVISVDAKKKELVGNKANGGAEYQPVGEPDRVEVHDFPDPEIGKAIPYGVYDIGANAGWVSVGDDHDTAAFAVATIGRWWDTMGVAAYPDTHRLMITADAGGSNSYRGRLWKVELAKLAERTGLEITVCHYPPGTSKWNKIEHRLFSQITMNWRGRPLLSHDVVVELISATTTRTGLTVQAARDEGYYPTGVKISDKQLAALPITPHDWHGQWNYTLTTK